MAVAKKKNKASNVKKVSKNIDKQQNVDEQKIKEENINYGRCCK